MQQPMNPVENCGATALHNGLRRNPALKPLPESGWFFSLIIILLFSMPVWDAGARPLGTVKVGLISSPSFYVRHLVLEPLMVSNAGRIRPVLAESWQWVDDNTLEVHLRTEVRFHDDSLFDAAAVKANFDFFRQSSPIQLFRDYFSKTRCEIIDPYRLRFVLPAADNFFLSMLSKIFQIAPTQLRKIEGKPYLSATFSTPGDWGTGPFRITTGFIEPASWSSEIALTAFEDYWNPAYPKVKRIILYDLSRHFGWQADQALRNANRTVMESEGLLDIVPAILFETLDIAGSQYAKIEKLDWKASVGLINMRKKASIWRDIRLRRALQLAIDRPPVIELMKGNARFYPGLIAPGHPGHDPDLTPYEHAPQQARKLLHDAGFGRGLKIKILTPSMKYAVNTMVGEMLSEAGFIPEFVPLGIDELVQKFQLFNLDRPIEKQDWDLCFVSVFNIAHHPYIDVYKRYFDKTGYIRWIETDDELQRIIDRVGQETDETRQDLLLRQCEALVHCKAYVLNLFFYTNPFAVNEKILVPPELKDERFFLREIELAPDHWSLRHEPLVVGHNAVNELTGKTK